MRNKLNKSLLENLVKVGALLCLILILVRYQTIQTSSFRYHYSIGRPWAYESLQAPFDFPIYKSSEIIDNELAAALDEYSPCFRLTNSFNTITDSLRKINPTDSIFAPYTAKTITATISTISKNLGNIYNLGILSSEDYLWVKNSSYSDIKIINQQQIAKTVDIDSCYTPLSAYSRLISKLDNTEKDIFERLSIDKILTPNLQYDSALSDNLRQTLIVSVSTTEGEILKDERIIDRGEIVTADKYQILESLKQQYTNTTTVNWSIWTVIGDVILISVFIILLILYLSTFRPHYLKGIKNLLFFILLVGIVVSLAVGAISLGKRLDLDMCVYIVPIAWVAILVRIFFDARTSLFIHWITILLVAFMLDDPFTFVTIQVAVGMVVVTSLKDISVRSQLASTSAYVFLTYSVVYTAFMLSLTGNISKLDPTAYILFAINSILLLLAYGLIYICEKVFKMISAMTLLELSNVNSDIMLQLAEKAPGTFQHSLQVSNLATEAAKRIGADSLLVRTGAMYHDIGKMANAQNFTENQAGGINPLTQMSNIDAAQVVINHVQQGVEIAKKEHLPQPIIDFILTHHGKSKTWFFYNTYINEHPNEDVDDSLFTYPGPYPSTKEQGILMMADAVEARSRSLQDYTDESINKAVEQIITSQINNGQLNQTPLTFKDIEDIKDVFKEKLRNIYHHRITYPEIKKI